jgi:multidrug efflux pump subunit AcrA (membrane-fusion protein)
MPFRKILLGTAAAAFIAAPALAEENYYHQNPTPEEQAQTQSLNSDAQSGTVAPGAQAKYDAQQEEYARQQADYQQKKADYEAQRNRYAQQRAHYAAQRDAYYAEVSGDPWLVPAVAPPAWPDEMRLNRLYVISDPGRELARAPLVDGNGHWVGRVRDVETENGYARRVKIYLYRDHRYVWVRPGLLRYDASDGVLFTHLDYRDLANMPGYNA